MWICKNCNEDIEDDFDVCWSCNSNKDGSGYNEDTHSKSKEDTDLKSRQGEIINRNTQYPTLIGISIILKKIGIIVGGLWCVSGLISGLSSSSNNVGLIIVGFIFGIVSYFFFLSFSELIKLFVNIGDDVYEIKKQKTK